MNNASPETSPPRGHLFVIAAPSGAGKTSLVKALLHRRPQLRLSVSHTTRRARPTEEEGREYFFVSIGDFHALIAQEAFLEHAQVFDNHYGTGRAPVETQTRGDPQSSLLSTCASLRRLSRRPRGRAVGH